MAEDYHIDLSGRLFDKKVTGIACVSSLTKSHVGCALNLRLKRHVDKTLKPDGSRKGHAKLYAICIYYLIKDRLDDINKLIICNDEDFQTTKQYLKLLLGDKHPFDIISITEFQTVLNRKVKSFADNYAKHYRKRGLKKNRWNSGKHLSVIPVTYSMIKEKWEID